MGAVKTSDQMINGVRRRAMIPTDNATFSDTDFLEIMNEELLLNLVSTIMKVHEEFYVYPYRATVETDETEYTIPARAIGNKIRLAKLRDAAGQFVDLTRIKPEDSNRYIYNNRAFYLQDNKIVFVNTPQSGTVQMDIYLRPNQLVKAERGAVVSAIDTDTGVVTFASNVPSHFAANIKYDFVKKSAPCKILGFDVTATAQATTSLTFATTDIPDDLEVGDYVTIAEETIVPQMPVEMVPILEQLAAIYCLEAIGDTEAAQQAERKLQKMEYNVNTLIDNRTEGNPQKINNTNSLLRRYRKRYNIYRGS